MDIEILLKILQASLVPAVLISGFGLLLLSMTNRLARPIDRIRLLCKDFKQVSNEEKYIIKQQVDILYRRSQLLQTAIIFVSLSIIFLSAIILMTFCIFIFNLHLQWGIQISFALSLLFLIASLVYFTLDIRLVLNSLKIEIQNRTK